MTTIITPNNARQILDLFQGQVGLTLTFAGVAKMSDDQEYCIFNKTDFGGTNQAVFVPKIALNAMRDYIRDNRGTKTVVTAFAGEVVRKFTEHDTEPGKFDLNASSLSDAEDKFNRAMKPKP